MNPFKKQKPKFMTEEELQELESKINSREKEFELRQKQKLIESGFKKTNNVDLEKLKKYLIVGVCAVFIAIIVWKVVLKFI